MTKEENEILTRVGAGTPMGELLRRYWWPVGISADLKDKPSFIRLLCEDLVLFRDRKGRPGVLGALCSHRRANLCLGSTEERGLRCRYHGWVYDINGNVLETPGEPRESKLKESLNHLSYQVEELGGLVFTYLGPQPAPLLPRFHFLAAEGEHRVFIQGFGNCNFLQAVENGIDPFHTSFLHGDIWGPVAVEPERTWFEGTEWGIVYKAIRPGRKKGEYNYREHPHIMPGISSGGDGRISAGEDNPPADELPVVSARWSVPIDDTHMMHVRVHYWPPDKAEKDRKLNQTGTRTAPYQIEPYKEYKESNTPTLGYHLPKSIGGEDAVMLNSLGHIADRENENLSVIDGGIAMTREMYLKGIETVKAGGDPKGVIRDKQRNQLIVIGGLYRWISADERMQLQRATG
ncbi:MAG: Rieske 2Fe-2S domain-containing protein [Candidatus Binatia bacterium]